MRRTWPKGKNDKLLASVAKCGEKRKWGQLVAVFRSAVDKVDKVGHRGGAAIPGRGLLSLWGTRWFA